jgi:hypothetical protein
VELPALDATLDDAVLVALEAPAPDALVLRLRPPAWCGQRGDPPELELRLSGVRGRAHEGLRPPTPPDVPVIARVRYAFGHRPVPGDVRVYVDFADGARHTIACGAVELRRVAAEPPAQPGGAGAQRSSPAS